MIQDLKKAKFCPIWSHCAWELFKTEELHLGRV